jgi:hypothetical protein
LRFGFQIKNITLLYVLPCSLIEIYPRFGGMHGLHLEGRRAELAAASLLLAMPTQAVISSDMLVNFYQTTRHHISKDNALTTHRCQDLEHNIVYTYLRSLFQKHKSELHFVRPYFHGTATMRLSERDEGYRLTVVTNTYKPLRFEIHLKN